MATSERWEILYDARDRTGYLREAANDADLYVTCFNIHGPGNARVKQILTQGTRAVPYGILYAGIDRGNPSHMDPRTDPRWYDMAETYPGPALEQIAETCPWAVVKDEQGNAVGYSPDWENPPLQEGFGHAGEYYEGPGSNSYWTNEEVERETWYNELYSRAYEYALRWWIVLHGVNAGAVIDYPDDLQQVVSRINIEEAGDPAMALLNQNTLPPAGDIDRAGDSPYAAANVLPDAGGLLSEYGEYLPMLAAGGVVLYALSRRFTKGA